MVNKMKGVSVIILFIFGYRVNASTPHCESVNGDTLICYGINNLPSKELLATERDSLGYTIERITILDSNIKTIPSHSFSGFSTIKYLDLNKCNINTIEKNCFSDLKQLWSLQLNSNNISKIDTGTLNGFFELNILDLSSNNLKLIDKDAFQNLTQLNQLLLNNNKLQVLPEELFSSLHHIEVINLSSNNLTTLGTITFRNLTNLSSLKLINNQLRALPPTIFKDLSSVTSLDLSRNSLTNLSYESLSVLKSLSYLDISDNQLTTLDSTYNCHTISERFSRLCSNESNVNASRVSLFLDMKYLNVLHLERNYISKIGNQSLRGLTNLKKLYMSGNGLHEIHEDAFKDLYSLNYLSLDNNNIEIIYKSTFFNLRNLMTLLLNNNKIRTLPVSLFKNLDSLIRTLSLSSNFLTHIPYGLLSHLKRLQDFDISHNQLVELNPISFHYLEELNSFNVNHNNISNVNVFGLTSVLSNLRSINIDGNKWICEILFHIINLLKDRDILVKKGDAFDGENVHGIRCIPTKSKKVLTSTTTEKTVIETNNFQKNISNILMNISKTLSNLTVHKDEKERVKDQNIQERILNNSGIIVELLESVVQQREDNLKSILSNKMDTQSKVINYNYLKKSHKEINDLPDSKGLQTVQTTSTFNNAKTYAIIILSAASLIMFTIIAFTHCRSLKRNTIIDRIRHRRSRQQNQSNANLVINNDVEILNTQI